MEHEIHCQGCGVAIQTTDSKEAGYVPQSSIENEELLCRRCFRLKHYNETQEVSITDDDFLKMVSSIREANGLVVHVVDIFDVQGSLISNLPRIVGDHPIILVGNKVDLLPKSTNQRRLSQWLRASANEANIKVEDVFLISSTKGHGVEDLAQQIDKYRKKKNVYIVGTTNVGKSTFINQIIQQSSGLKDVITTSYFPGTTLGFIEIPLDDSTYLIDTPGIVNKQQMVHYVSKKDLKLITPAKEIKARGYQINSEQTLFFGGLARLDFIKGDKQTFVCYFSNQIPIHRTKLDNAESLYEQHLGKLLSPPDAETLEKLPPLTKSTFKIGSDSTDIVFPGLGWVTIKEGDVTVVVHSPKDVAVSVRRSFT